MYVECSPPLTDSCCVTLCSYMRSTRIYDFLDDGGLSFPFRLVSPSARKRGRAGSLVGFGLRVFPTLPATSGCEREEER